MAIGNWGQPDVANTDAMQGPAQISAVADYAAANSLRHFATVSALTAATGAVSGYVAVVDATPGAIWRYDGTNWKMFGNPHFPDATTRSTALPAPVQGMRCFMDNTGTEWVYFGAYNSSTNPSGRPTAGWYPAGAGLVPIVPTSVTGTGVTVSSGGAVTFSSTATISVNGCFGATFDNYHIEVSMTCPAATQRPGLVLRSAGADSSAANYDLTLAYSTGAASATSLLAQASFQLAAAYNMTAFSAGVDLTAPYLAQLTTARILSTGFAPATAPLSGQGAGGHRLASSFDGFTLGFSTVASGTVRIYGYSNGV